MDRLSNIVKQRLAAQQVATDAEHPSADTLVAFAEQGLRAPTRQQVLSHLATCSACRQTVSLATSAEQISSVAVPRRRALQFPMALRWASAAAALAVAIGVGVLSYEHQNRLTLSATATVSPETREKSVTPSAQPEIKQSSGVAKEETNAETETKPVNSRRANSEARNSQSRIAANAEDSAGALEPFSKKTQRGGTVGSLVAGSQPIRSFARPNVADGFIASNRVAPPPPPPPPQAPADAKAIALADIAAAPRSAAAGASAAPVQLASEGRSNEVEVPSSPGRVDKSEFSGPAEISLQERSAAPVARKTMASAALGGPIHGAVNGVVQIVHWTITATGKLERRLSDGRFTLIEPAPGTSFRTVAAQGIEVWAAGSQPDLSAKEWQQRPVLFHSSDAGETWTRVEGPWQSPISTLNLDSVNALTVITPNGSWTTLNAGKSWIKR